MPKRQMPMGPELKSPALADLVAPLPPNAKSPPALRLTGFRDLVAGARFELTTFRL